MIFNSCLICFLLRFGVASDRMCWAMIKCDIDHSYGIFVFFSRTMLRSPLFDLLFVNKSSILWNQNCTFNHVTAQIQNHSMVQTQNYSFAASNARFWLQCRSTVLKVTGWRMIILNRWSWNGLACPPHSDYSNMSMPPTLIRALPWNIHGHIKAMISSETKFRIRWSTPYMFVK